MRLLLAILLLVATPCYAQNNVVAPDQFYEISDFSGGLKSHVSPYLTQKNSSTESQNVRFNKTYGKLSKRDRMLELGSCHSAPVKSLHRYYRSDDTQYTLATSSTYVDYIDDDGDCTNLYANASDGKRWTWVTYKDLAIGMNGTDRAKKWDGSTVTTSDTDGARTAGDLVADLGAPFAELNTGSNLTASRWYQYKVAFYDGSVYKFSNARSNPILTGSSVRDVTLTDVPLGPSGTTARVIYRTSGNTTRSNVVADNSFYRVATISDNSTRTFNDTVSDATLAGDSAPTWATVSAGVNVTVPYSKYSLIHKERLFLANDPSGTISGKSTIYWSDILNPDYFNYNTDYELIRPDDGDEITTILNNLGVLTIGKTGTWSKIYTDESSSTNWSVSTPFSYIGCDAPYSAVNTPNGIAYRNRKGLYTFSGQSSEIISDVVTDHVRDMLETNEDDIVGVYYDNQYLVSYTSKQTGSANNDRVLILDLVRNAYTEDTKNIDSWAKYDSGNDYGTLYSGSSLTDGLIYAHSGSFSNLVYRYKSQFEQGNTSDIAILGTEDEPYLEIGWGKTINNASLAGVTINSATATSIIDRPDLDGVWTSPAINVNAQSLDKLYWNENLGAYGNVTWAVRSAATEGGITGASWSSEFSDPTGSDISGETANAWVQLRASLSTSDINYSPTLVLEDSFVMRMTYQKEGSSGEASILSLWKGGFSDLGAGENPKRIKEVQVYYEGTDDDLTVNFENDAGEVFTFDVDMSVVPTASSLDQYYGNSTEKIYVYIPSVTNQAIGRKWRFSVTDNGTTAWNVNRIVVRFDNNAYVTFK